MYQKTLIHKFIPAKQIQNHRHQFKLERWTDAGLVVHAAFASDMLDEVMELRETLLECMDHSTADKFEDDVLNDPTPYKRF